jgi:hypothetical protein
MLGVAWGSPLPIRPAPPKRKDAMSIKIGDRVSWSTPQGRTQGVVREKKDKDFTFDGQKFTATSDEPAYIVESEKSGKKAAHKGSALRTLKKSEKSS